MLRSFASLKGGTFRRKARANSARTVRAVVVFLTMAALLTGSMAFIPSAANASEKKWPDIGPGPSLWPQGGTDVSNLKLIEQTETTNTYENPDGSKTILLAPNQLNFKDGDGSWKELDNTLTDVGGVIRNGAGPNQVAFADSTDKAEIVTVSDEDVSVALVPPTAKGKKAKVAKSSITYEDAFGTSDLRYNVTGKSVKEEIVIPEAPKKAPVFTFELKLKGLKAIQEGNGSIELVDNVGTVRYTIPQGIAWDSAKTPSKSAVSVLLSGNKLVVTPEAGWLMSDERVFPVVVDPELIFGAGPGGGSPAAIDTYISRGNPNSNYVNDYFLNVGYCSPNNESYTYIKWNVSELNGKVINSARLDMHAISTPTAQQMSGQPLKMWRVEQNWDPYTFTWSQMANGPVGNHGSVEKDLWGMTTSSTGGYDVTDWVQAWSNGGVPNYGVSMDANGWVDMCWQLQSNNSGASGPNLVVNVSEPDTGRRSHQSYFDQTIDQTSGLSVNLANGNLSINQNDISAPGRAGADLIVDRNWSSLRSGAQREFGNSWQYGAVQTHLFADSASTTVYLPGLSPARFNRSGSTFVMPPGINADLTRYGSGASEYYQLKFRDSGELWEFHDLPDTTGRYFLHFIADRNNNRTYYHYDLGQLTGTNSWPRLTHIIDSFGQQTNITYTNNVITKIQDFAGRHTDYGYTNGKLTTVANVDGATTTYSYDSNGRVSQVQTAAGRKIAFTYDATGRASTVKWITSSTTDVDPVWTFGYSAPSGSPLLGTTTVTNPKNEITTYKWDSNLIIKKTTDPNGHTQQGEWDANFNQLEASNGTGHVTKASYNSGNSLTGVSAPDLNSSNPGSGRSTAYQYPTAGEKYQPNKGTDTQGNTSDFEYDANGNRSKTTNGTAVNDTTSLTYNQRPDTSVDGNVKTAKDRKGGTTTYNYSNVGRLTGIDYPAPLGDESFTYDSVGRIATATDGKGQVSTYTYNNKGQMLTASTPGSTTVTFTYDNDGLMTGRVDAAGTWSFTYDDLRRPLSKTAPGNATNSVTYDAAGRVATYTDSNGTVAYGYDAAGNLTKLAETGGSCTGTVSKCSTFTYDAANRRTSTVFPNGVTENVMYDTSGRIEYLWAEKNGARLTDYAYRYTNANGDDTGLTQYVTDDIAQTWTQYGYDDLNRLTDVTVHRNSDDAVVDEYAYTWDVSTNRTAAWRSGSATRTFGYNSVDQMTGIDNNWTTFAYDANGSTVSSNQGFASTYNTRGQATSITPTGGSAVSNTYAGIDQTERVTRGSTTFHNRVIGGLADEVTGGVVTSYVLDPSGSLHSQHKNGTTHYYLSDKLASVVALMDSNGNVSQRFAYDPFGKLLTTSIAVESSFKYAGGFYDTATKLYKFGNRYYDPNNGIWTQRDVVAGNITDPKTMNRYVYVGGDPINHVDPTGYKWTSWAKGAIVVASFATLPIGGTAGLAIGAALTAADVGVGIAAGDSAGKIAAGAVLGGAGLKFSAAGNALGLTSKGAKAADAGFNASLITAGVAVDRS